MGLIALGADSKSEEKPQQPEFRTWTDTTGKFKTDAVFVEFKDGIVQLKKRNGSVVSVPIEKLSTADQKNLRPRPEITYRIGIDL
jgi:hypothetical protein